MMWRLYYAVLRVMNPVAIVVLRLSNALTGTRRVRVAVQRPDGRILLVVNALGDRRWSLPGGGVGRRETDSDAAVRELEEETGLKIASTSLISGGDIDMHGYATPLYFANVSDNEADQLKIRKTELQKYQWFSLEKLPPARQKHIDVAANRLLEADEV